jgi:gamma-glutamyltranspeptidase / glutathione hydrolase
LHLIIESMRRAYAARNMKLGDPDFVKLPTARLLSPEWAKEQRATIQPQRSTPSSEIKVDGPASGMGPHTTHFSVVDAAGNAVSLTTTINGWYGSGVTVRGGGFLLNNEMDDFASSPGNANGFGLVQGEPNAIAPKKRMLSSMSPTVVTGKDGTVQLVLGGAGGPTIITAVLQELLNVVDFGLDIGAAVAAPRFHMQHLPDTVMFETGGLAAAARASMESFGYSFKNWGHIADAPAIGRSGSGLAAEWVGVAEPRRKGGLALGL